MHESEVVLVKMMNHPLEKILIHLENEELELPRRTVARFRDRGEGSPLVYLPFFIHFILHFLCKEANEAIPSVLGSRRVAS